jgi:glycosyltransferase involved in cell wall biosynthesis
MSVQPEVGVITPVYNGAKYLAESIESVLAQTYSNWTLTIVNNCSTDSTAEIARSYAAKDRRIRVHENQRFLPAIANHNAALRLLPSDSLYCKLLFADDWLFPECLERLVALAEAQPTVGILTAYSLQGSEVIWTGLPYPSTVVRGKDACRSRLLGGPYVFGTGTTQMYRAEIVRGVESFFNESNTHCDSEICFRHFEQWDLGFIHQILSYTRPLRPESLTTEANRLNTLLLMTLYELITYGPVYLTPAEQQLHLTKKWNEYYSVLAGYVLEGRDLWNFHKQNLSKLGFPVDRGRLATAVFRRAWKAFFKNPFGAIGNVLAGGSPLSWRFQKPR